MNTDYKYDAYVKRVVDGDTIDLEIDLGFKIKLFERCRLYGVNTPEIHTKDKNEKVKGKEARDFVRDKIEDKHVEIITHKQGKFGRYLVVVMYYDNGKYTNLNKQLIEKGLAVEYFGGKR